MDIQTIQAQLVGKVQNSANEADFYQSISDILSGVLESKLVTDAKAETAALQTKLDTIVQTATKVDIVPADLPVIP